MAWIYENDQLNWTEPELVWTKLVSTSENESEKKIEREMQNEKILVCRKLRRHQKGGGDKEDWPWSVVKKVSGNLVTSVTANKN